MVGLVIAVYLIGAAALAAGHHDGIIKDDTYESTVRFEYRAAKDNVEELGKVCDEFDKQEAKEKEATDEAGR